MKIKSAKQQNGIFVVVTEDKTIFVPDDMGNNDRVHLQEWLDAGNQLEAEDSPITIQAYNWQGLAIAFKISELNQILNDLKDEGANPEINAIWRISDELTQIVTQPIFSDNDRVGGMNRELVALFEKLKLGGVTIPATAKDELTAALIQHGFEKTSNIVKEIKL